MIIGKTSKGEKMIKFEAQIHCNSCKRQVPGGLKTGEGYYQSDEFEREFEEFKKNYLCGICRDAKRVERN